ncbi:LuxR C-terminal-related transcriptional regulator [Eggerthella sp. YY7918]|uniref:LuxR C-terminal-related transcriptional regulator n=1 Tax=Eggerthella sp. (strain YY7918) TaxID=502558 RepID=UPI0002EAEA30|nr:LuxR C-terminal-related transcriptional regulator [Eggerthella sp. YY7918]
MLLTSALEGVVSAAARGAVVAVVMGISFALLVAMWGSSSLVYAAKHRIPALCAMVLAFILGFIVSTALVPLERNAALLLMCFPALSGACWLGSHRRQQLPGCKLTKTSQLPLARILVLGVFLLLISLLRGPFYTGSIDYIPGWDVIAPNALSILMAVLTLAFLLLNRSTTQAFRNALIAAALLLLAGLLLAIYGDVASASLHLIIVGKSCFELFLWLLLSDSGRTERISAVTTFIPFFLGFELLASSISYLAIPSLAALLNATFSSVIPLMALATALVFVAGCFIYLGFEHAPNATPETNLNQDDRNDDDYTAAIEAKLQTLNGYNDLTPREKEIATLLAQGNSYKRIADLLYVSPSTVQTHAKSLYRKLAIHTKQELVDHMQHESAER